MSKDKLNREVINEYFTKPWYLQPWFIGLLMASFLFVIPPLVGIVLIIIDIQDNKKKKILLHELNLDKLATLDKLDKELADRLAHKTAMATLEETQSAVENTKAEQAALSSNLASLNQKLIDQSGELEMQEFGFYGQNFEIETSAEYKAKMIELQLRQKQMVKNNTASQFTTNFRYNNSLSEGKRMVMREVKIALWAFNTHCDNVITNVTYRNYVLSEKKIRRALEIINENEQLQSITPEYLALKLEELNTTFHYKEALEHEKELLREQREKEREDRKLQQEIIAAKAAIEKDEKHINAELSRLQSMLLKEKDDKGKLEKQIAELEGKLTKLDEKKKDVDYRENNAKAGYVYIISNIGAFGEGVVKIGVTRRLEPLDRIRELGDASVPFRFDVHALLFSDKAFQLEAALHSRFAKQRLNRMNHRKEFFKIPVDELQKAVEEESKGLVNFEPVPEAREYRQSLVTD